MARCSNEQVAKILANEVLEGRATEEGEDIELNRKIALVTEGFSTTNKYCKLLLSSLRRGRLIPG